MMRVWFVAALSLAAAGLAGCSSTKEALGVGKVAPNEFAVTTQAPLVLPPDFELKPPSPGAPALGERASQYQAQAAVLGPGSFAPGMSPAEQALISASGGDKADPNIKATVNREAGLATPKDENLAEQILFWRDPAAAPPPIVDPAAEAQRVQQDKAAGQPVSGDGTATKAEEPEDDGGLFDWF